MPNVTIVGIGRVGGSFALAFQGSRYKVRNRIGTKRGVPSEAVLLSDLNEITDELILISTPDGAIADVAEELASKIKNNPVVIHTSGPLSSAILKPLADIGCSTGSLHPLVSFNNSGSGAKSLEGAYFCVEGDERATLEALAIVEFLGGHAVEVPCANKTLYHAAAVTACGHLTALIDVAASMMRAAGVPNEVAIDMLLPLVKSTVTNIEESGTAAALTGTFARGDVAGFKRQLDIFADKLNGNEIAIFLDLAERSNEIVQSGGTRPGNARQIAEMIAIAKRELR